MRSVRIIVIGTACLALILGLAFADIIPLGDSVPNSILVGITTSGLDFFCTVAETYIQNEVDIIDLIKEQNPFVDECILGCCVTLNATGGRYDPIQLQIQLTNFDWMPPTPNSLYIRALLANFVLEMDLDWSGWCGKGVPTSGKGDIDVEVTGRFEASFQIEYFATPTPHLEGSFKYLDIFFDDFDLDCGGWEFVCELFEGIIRETARSMIRDEISAQIATILNDVLNQLPLSYQVEIENPLEEGEIEILRVDIADFQLHTAPSMNTATVVVESAQYFEGIDDCVDLGGQIGSLYTPSTPPEFSVPSPGGHSYHIAAAISDDMVNQLLYSAYATGLLCISMTLEELFPTKELPKEFQEFADKVGEEEGLFWIITYPHKEPIFTVGGPDNAHITITIEDFDAAVYTYLCERWARFFAATIGFTASGTLSVSTDTCDTGPCTVVTVDLPSYELSLDVTYSELSGLDEETIQELVDSLLEQYMGDLLEQYGRIEVPALELPGGIYLLGETVDILPIGNSGDYLGIYANFVTAK